MNKLVFIIGLWSTISAYAQSTGSASPKSRADYGKVVVSRSNVTGIGAEKGVMRRDPSDIIKVGELYYVWYSKGPKKSGYDATLWYATSPDGKAWTEKGMALAKGNKGNTGNTGKPGSGAWDEASVFTPNILVAEGKYWLFYTGISSKPKVMPDSRIGIAVADSPDGPWLRLPNNPVLRNSDKQEDFDSHLIDDACLMVREGKYWLYYKGRQLGKKPSHTQMGLAIADHPQGPYVKHPDNPVIPGNHAVLAWPQGQGVAAMIGDTGPADIIKTIQYAADGVHFSKTHDVIDGPRAGGFYRPEAISVSDKGGLPHWGLEIGTDGKLPYLKRFECKVTPTNESAE
ncbi:MAG: family 43 glycosylhydrolase [Akkermansiaceae bacterium]|nr:family 43 glycosylhydrolase [Akkermansiaceae bacterium]